MFVGTGRELLGHAVSYGVGGNIDAPYEYVIDAYHRGRLAEATGDTTTARHHYETFIGRWGKSDGRVVEVDAARTALRRLRPH